MAEAGLTTNQLGPGFIKRPWRRPRNSATRSNNLMVGDWTFVAVESTKCVFLDRVPLIYVTDLRDFVSDERYVESLDVSIRCVRGGKPPIVGFRRTIPSHSSRTLLEPILYLVQAPIPRGAADGKFNIEKGC